MHLDEPPVGGAVSRPVPATFDLVVFDEASQITPWDAAGVLRRAKQCIVVGDSKPLPPTNFFDRASTGDDELEEQDSLLKSILDEREGSGMQQLPLLWHYRSAHEHLITFSNRKYYKSELLTFPGKGLADPRLGVHFRYLPEGAFDRGQSRTNQIEAEAVVGELVKRLLDPVESQRSYGIVTFNQAQQGLIEKMLEEKRRLHPQIEPYFNKVAETVFVKNLENVQGDERDVILFSIGYGKDKQGVMRMNFGPLNKVGGQRRLNVAFSRARQQMVIFSSILASDIDLARSNAEGVRDFKAFLAFAERGVTALDEETTYDPSALHDSIFEEQVSDALKRRGWTVHPQVGCSSYRIDLGVVHPDRPGEYLAGVECDGATYHSAATARDRDRLREQVLRKMGWEIERIWSTDWWENSRQQLDRLDARLRELLVKAPPPPVVVEEEPVVVVAAEPVVRRTPPPIPYTSAQLPPGVGEAEGLLMQAAEVEYRLGLLVQSEAPITVQRAMRRLAECWGVSRIGSRLKPFLERIISRGQGYTVVDGVLWTCDPPSYREVRAFDFEDMPVPEIANAVERVLRDAVALPEMELMKGTARYLGVGRVGSGVQARIREAIELLLRDGRAVGEDGQIVFPRA